MKKLLVTLAALLVSVSSFAQGSVIFNNRTQAGDRPITYADGPNAGQGVGSLPGGFAQLVLVNGATFTPLTPVTPFRTGNAANFFTEVRPFTVTGVEAGASATFVIRAWQGADSYETAVTTVGAYAGQSSQFVIDALGGTPPGGGLPVATPTLDTLQAFSISLIVPEPSTIALGVLGAAALLFRRRK